MLNNLDGGPTLLRNRRAGAAGHWIVVRLVGEPALNTPRDAIGSVAYCRVKGSRQRGEVSSGRGYLSQSSLRIHFGLGAAEKVDDLEVLWSNGQREKYAIPSVDRLFVIEQGRGIREQ